MTIVLDTNVVVSGVISPHGCPGRILEAVLTKTFVLLYDDRILAEYRSVLKRPEFGFKSADIEPFLGFVMSSGHLVAVEPVNLVLPDPTDVPFIEVAMAGDADALITGNIKHFRPRRGTHRVRILTPAKFINFAGSTVP